MNDSIMEAVCIINRARHVVVFTGAGISVESGVPPFRGPNGMWTKMGPEKGTHSFFMQHPAEWWDIWRERFEIMWAAKPNEAHRIVAKLEKQHTIHAVVTQNVDGMHQAAGSKRVFEVHGSCASMRCDDCGYSVEATREHIQPRIPRCRKCTSGVMRPDVVMFEEHIPVRTWKRVMTQMAWTWVVIIIGTSGMVPPASNMPHSAWFHGARIIEINPEPSAFTSTCTEIFIQAGAVDGVTGIDNHIDPGAR